MPLLGLDLTEPHQFELQVLQVIVTAIISAIPVLLALWYKHIIDMQQYRMQHDDTQETTMKVDAVKRTLDNGIKTTLDDIQQKVSEK